MKTWKVLLVCAVFAVAGAVPACAESIVVPNANTNVPGNNALSTPLRSDPRTMQVAFGAAQLSGVAPGSLVTGLTWRVQPGDQTWPRAPRTFSLYDIQVSTSPFAPGALHNTFADNIGPDVVTVRSGPLTIPAGAFPGGPGLNPFGFLISFTTPFAYLGGTLLVTIRHTGNGVDDFFADAVNDVNGIMQSKGAARFNATVDDGITGRASPITRLEFTPIPEQSTLTLGLLGLGCLMLLGGRRHRSLAKA